MSAPDSSDSEQQKSDEPGTYTSCALLACMWLNCVMDIGTCSLRHNARVLTWFIAGADMVSKLVNRIMSGQKLKTKDGATVALGNHNEIQKDEDEGESCLLISCIML